MILLGSNLLKVLELVENELFSERNFPEEITKTLVSIFFTKNESPPCLLLGKVS